MAKPTAGQLSEEDSRTSGRARLEVWERLRVFRAWGFRVFWGLGLEELSLAKSAEAWWMEPARRKMPASVPGLIKLCNPRFRVYGRKAFWTTVSSCSPLMFQNLALQYIVFISHISLPKENCFQRGLYGFTATAWSRALNQEDLEAPCPARCPCDYPGVVFYGLRRKQNLAGRDQVIR